MTEQEWITSQDPAALLDFTDGGEITTRGPTYRVHTSDRKLRLWITAMIGASAHAYVRSSVLDAWREGEPFKGYSATFILNTTREWCDRSYDNPGDPPMSERADLLREIVGNPFCRIQHKAGCNVCLWAGSWLGSNPCVACEGRGWHYRDGIDPAWLTPNVLSLAESAYSEGRQANGVLDPFRLALVADALEEAGCAGEVCPACGPLVVDRDPLIPDDISLYHCGLCDLATRRLPHPVLAHLRSPGSHVKGCFALDLVLGKI